MRCLPWTAAQVSRLTPGTLRSNFQVHRKNGFCYSSGPGLRPRSLAPETWHSRLLIRQELLAKFLERLLLYETLVSITGP